MRWGLVVVSVATQLGVVAAARAESGGSGVLVKSQAQELAARDGVARDAAVVLVQEDRAARRTVGPFRQQDLPWLMAGATGALVPLAMFALPALSVVWLGPFAPVAFLVAIAVGSVATAAGGALAWAVSAIFSNLKSGFFLPILYSGMTGMAATLLGGMAAALIMWTGIGVAYLAGGARDIYQATAPDPTKPLGSVRNIALLTSAVIATVVWGGSVVAGSVGGPMIAALTYRLRGEPKRVAAPSLESPSGQFSIPREHRSTSAAAGKEEGTPPAEQGQPPGQEPADRGVPQLPPAEDSPPPSPSPGW